MPRLRVDDVLQIGLGGMIRDMTEAQKQQLRDCIAILSESIETFDGDEAMAQTMYADMQDVLDRLASLLAEVT